MMSALKRIAILLLVSSTALAQAAPASGGEPATPRKPKTTKTRKAAVAGATAEDIKALRDALAAQQQQLDEMRQAMLQRDQQLQQTQQQLAEAQTAVRDAQTKVDAVQSANSESKPVVTQLQNDMADVKTALTNTAASTQDDQKRVSELASTLGRFRFSGDVRVRGEGFWQDRTADRYRPRIRVRVGADGKLNEDFTAGFYLATGNLTDPTSTNETLTNAFERKTIGLDRGFITYNPAAHKWISLTGGKFAYTWQRTNVTFDPDINPEGFSEKFSLEVKTPLLKNVSFTGLQLWLNENGGGNDAYAVGGQVAAKVQIGKLWTMTPSYTVLNFRNEGQLLRGVVAGSSPTGSAPGGPITAGVFAPNGMTNAVCGTPAAPTFCSQFLYSDVILANQIKTPMAKLPLNVTGEYFVNLNARSSRSHLYYGEVSLGQNKAKNDFQVGYAFNRQEQDSTIASFVESDQRAPTNVVQNRIFFLWRLRSNTSLGYTQWIGRTLDSTLQNARLAPGTIPGTREPWLKRGQLDLIYTF